MDELLTTEQAAKALGLEPKTLVNYRTRGCGPAYVALSRKAVRYSASALADYIARHTIAPVQV